MRTFEAASWLRRMGADTARVREFFQTDLSSFQLRSQIVADASMPFPGIALSKCEGKHVDVQVINSKAADEMLNIRGIKASFVLGQNEEGVTVISARSLGDINVQTIMEKLGGGGNLTKAGAQTDMQIDEAMERLKEILAEVELK